MGQQRLAKPQEDDATKRSGLNKRKSENTVLNAATTRKGEVFRAARRTNENVTLQATQHRVDIPVNKSRFNGYDGKQFSLIDQKRQRSNPHRPSLKVIPIGGLGEMGIGKNMMAIEYDNDILVIDAGLLFPGNDYPGINYIVPDITYLLENKHKIRGVAFTHGHLDHIGAAKHLLPKLGAPVYASRFTLAMVKRNMEESTEPGADKIDYIEVSPENHEIVQIGDSFSIEFVRVNHSIPDSTAVVVRTPVGVLINTGDWRFEENPIDGIKFDLERMTEISTKEGILMLMSDSTNCEDAGSHSHTEFDIRESIGEIMTKFPNSRMIISTFSSQIHRLQMIMEEAHEHGRKVAIAGYSMIQNIEVALRMGTIRVPKDTIVKMEDIVKLPDSKVVVLCTGSQGEFTAVLNRMASGAHKHLKVKGDDVVVLSSSAIPGNEKYIVRTVDGLMREGADVIRDRKTHLYGVGRIHLSGHGYYDDHVKLINAVNPKYYLPIHGEFHMLAHNAEIAEKECGMHRSNIFVCDSGDILEFYHDGSAKKTGRIQVGGIMYDDSGAEVSEVVLKDRIHMSQEGMFVVVLTVAKGSGRLLTSPDIISRGFIYLRDSEELMNLIRQYVKQKVARSFQGRKVDLDQIKKEIREEVSYILYDQTRRMPIVIPVINEIGVAAKPVQGQSQPQRNDRPQLKQNVPFKMPQTKKFPEKVYPDIDTIEPKQRGDSRGY